VTLDVDTSSIAGGTPLTIVNEYTLDNDQLTVAGLTVNVNEVELLTSDQDPA